ncbi:hypothetical protein RISK_003964 [Rhodopirellula islandica]|uniref:Uncharacterized protein n=1 Tax=Rhodopirellula islandica TaxID=595434 RepID=A0A0J1BBH5_RHOIS|nr:hypothetical protein RISK_003964 [Rhodopirellula islandica]
MIAVNAGSSWPMAWSGALLDGTGGRSTLVAFHKNVSC